MNKNSIKKEEIRQRVQNADTTDIEIIPAKPQVSFLKDTSEKRVAIYARVSTDDVRQTSSYEIQRKHYSDYT